jgi:hypothetical protein
MRTVIYGLSRTGTSALFYKLKRSLPANTICLFEPTSRGLIARLRVGFKSALARTGERDELAKVLPFREGNSVRLADFAVWDKQILIVRDPRDRLISALLYRIYNSDLFRREDALASFVRLLRRKEAAPASVPITAIVETYESLVRRSLPLASWIEFYGRRAIRHPLDFHDARPCLHLFRYEDLVEDRFAGLEAYMGRSLDGSAMVAPEIHRVGRTMGCGTWRDWFTGADVECFQPMLRPYLDRYYPDAEWRLSEAPQLNAEHGSGYVELIVNERRARFGLPSLSIS